MLAVKHVRLTADTQTLSCDEILSIGENKSLSVYSGIRKEILPDLAQILKDVDDFRLIIVLEDDLSGGDFVKGLDILKFLPNISHLNILAHQATPLCDIGALNHVNELRTFDLSGYLRKSMDFSPLRKFNKLPGLHINDLILPSEYYGIINDSPIESLSLRKISLADLDGKNSVKNLEIFNELTSERALVLKFPNLSRLALNNCKKLSGFSFLSSCLNLERLDINGVKGLNSLPKLKPNRLHTLQILNCKNLEDISHIYDLANLKNLAVTFSKVKFEDISCVFSKLPLRNFYFISSKNKENEMFENLALKHKISREAV